MLLPSLTVLSTVEGGESASSEATVTAVAQKRDNQISLMKRSVVAAAGRAW